jgi:hypothetical protein
MPENETIEKAKQDEQEGKSPSTQAGEFVREEMHHIREGKHGAQSAKQAIAIGLSKARRAGVKLEAPEEGASSQVRKKAQEDLRKGETTSASRTSSTRSRATSKALKREGRSAASKKSLSSQARSAATSRGPEARRESAMKGAETRKNIRSKTRSKKGAARTNRRRAA